MASLRWPLRVGLVTLVCLSAGCGKGGLVGPGAVSGMNVGAAEGLPHRQFDEALAALEAEGVQVVRSDIPWNLVQPLPPLRGDPGWRWSLPDAWVSAFARHGLTWEPILDYAVGWAKHCQGFCAPTGNAAYAAFARAVAARYGVGGTFWRGHPQLSPQPVQVFEIWNEENVTQFYVSPARYASLYAAARMAIRAVDPSARVIVGGLADDFGPFDPRRDYPSDYVRAMLAAESRLAAHVDGFGLHPYGATAQDVEGWMIHFRQTLDSLGEGQAPIYVTEFGWPTGNPLGESWRAEQMRFLGAALSRSNCGIHLVEPYDWINPATPPSADFGLAEVGARGVGLRPAGSAWTMSLRLRRPRLRLCPQG